MARFTLSGLAAVFALSTSALAQYNQTGPFFLKTVSTNTTIDGLYLGACHAGAAIEGLCTGSKTKPTLSSSTGFYLNQTSYSAEGPLIYDLPYNVVNGTGSILSSPMSLQFDAASNLAVPLFEPSYAQTSVGFNNSYMYIPASYNQSTFVEGRYPNSTFMQLQQWHVCYTIVGGYFYRALTWVTTGVPTNPTCQAVQVVQEFA